MRWAWAGLIAVLVFDVWLRCHTFAPSLRERFGVNLGPITGAASEPLDCDEAAYAYIGRRLVRGDVLYRDLTENKPPGGYWIYALAVALGGAGELTIRVMPIPFVLGTIVVIWRLGLRLGGPGAAVLAAGIFAVASTDPYLFGNGSNMEHFLNFFAAASLAAFVRAWERPGRAGFLTAGLFLGAACLVKQVAIVYWPLYLSTLFLKGREGGARPFSRRWKDMAALTGGMALVGVVALSIVLAQGAGADAVRDVVRYGGALATDTPRDPHSPSFLVRWIAGNSDPRDGRLPWPFSWPPYTDYRTWWGGGTWPLWLATPAALGWLCWGRGASAPRRLVAAWTLSAWVQVALPGLFWQHYYLLPLPGVALALAILLSDGLTLASTRDPRRPVGAAVALAMVLAVAGAVCIQVRDYLMVEPEQLTARYKGGRQWVANRLLGRELGRRSAVWTHPTLYVWGWQSPLYFYSGLDSPSRHFFVDELLKTVGGPSPPRVRTETRRLLDDRAAEIMNDLRARPPSLIFVGHPPFPALARFLNERYLRSDMARGLWVERGKYGEFETFASSRVR